MTVASETEKEDLKIRCVAANPRNPDSGNRTWHSGEHTHVVPGTQKQKKQRAVTCLMMPHATPACIALPAASPPATANSATHSTTIAPLYLKVMPSHTSK